MTFLASAYLENKMDVYAYIGDDEEGDLDEVKEIVAAEGLVPRCFTSFSEYKKAFDGNKGHHLFILDNYFQGVDEITTPCNKKIDTGNGTIAGFKLFTEYCNERKFRAPTRVILTKHKIEKTMRDTINRRKNKGDDIRLLRKHSAEGADILKSICKRVINCSRIEFVKEKFNYICGVFDFWELNDRERSILLGVSDIGDSFLIAAREGSSSRDLETRCDLLFRMKSNLDRVYGRSRAALQAKWLRSSIKPLAGKTPLEFLEGGYQHDLADLVLQMEGP